VFMVSGRVRVNEERFWWVDEDVEEGVAYCWRDVISVG